MTSLLLFPLAVKLLLSLALNALWVLNLRDLEVNTLNQSLTLRKQRQCQKLMFYGKKGRHLLPDLDSVKNLSNLSVVPHVRIIHQETTGLCNQMRSLNLPLDRALLGHIGDSRLKEQKRMRSLEMSRLLTVSTPVKPCPFPKH